MKMPRLTVRRLMSLVAVAGAIFAGLAVFQERERQRLVRVFTFKANRAREQETHWGGYVSAGREGLEHLRRQRETRAQEVSASDEIKNLDSLILHNSVRNAAFRRFEAHFALLRDKYTRAALRPREPFAPDPLAPPIPPGTIKGIPSD